MFKSHIKRTVLFAILGLVAALVVVKVTPPVYESSVEMLLGDDTRSQQATTSVFTNDVQAILNKNQASGASTERQLLSSQSVFYQALERVAREKNRMDLLEKFPDLYRMYDIEIARTTQSQMTVDAGVALILVRTNDAQISADVANQISFVYNDIRVRNSRESVQDAIRYISVQLTKAEDDLRKAERELKDYKTANNIADIGKEISDQTTTLAQMETSSKQLEAELLSNEAEASALRQQLSTTPKTIPLGSTDGKSQTVSALENQLVDLRSRREQLLGVYLEDHVNVKALDQAIKAVQKQLETARKSSGQETVSKSGGLNPVYQSIEQAMNGVQARVEATRARLNETRQQVTAQKAIVNALPAKQTEMESKMRNLKIFDDKFQRLKTMNEELRNRAETTLRATLVLNTAQVAKEPVAPDTKKILALGGAGGLCLGLLFSFLIESLKLRIQSSTQLTALTGLPVVAAIPAGQKTGAKALRALSSTSAMPPEAFRYMAFSMVTNNSKTMRTFMFTGIKTAMTTYSSALQFAVAVAKGGTRVLLVDGDMLKSPISKALDAGGKPGMSDLLVAESASNVEQYITSTIHPNLTLMPGGTDATMKFLTNAPQPKLEAIMQALRLNSDVIVFAVPPCDVLADASCLARLVDDVILVVSATQTNYRAVPLAQDLLQKAGARNISLVMADAVADEEPFSRKSAYLARQ